MDTRSAEVLEFNKILLMLEAEAGCGMSREMARALTPSTERTHIETALAYTTEAVDLIVRKGPLPTGGLHDMRRIASYAGKGGCLTMKQLLQVLFDLRIANRVVSFIKSDVPELPLISGMITGIEPHKMIADEIDRCIISEEEMSDNASPELARLRRAIQRKNESIRARLEHIVSSVNNRTYLQDNLVTVRDGRYVIPVKQEYKSRFPGVVHEQSKGGSTLFIEPQIVVDMNNELRSLEIEEGEERMRILQALSDEVSDIKDDLLDNQRVLTKLDFVMAKGCLSTKMKAEAPNISDDGILELKTARHPLLNLKKAVPININIGGDYRVLVITGPNTGGKTVTLKTVGLLSLMFQSGLHIPASSQSKMPVYKDVLADIGDEQSIEQSLSTFSSHMRNITGIIDKAGEGSLVLLDELGAGTDPTEGAALAISMLEAFFNSGVSSIATTHYTELKKYALSTDGVENASMEFDVETLSPTYRLTIGIPGKSNAFAIASKLGLPTSIINRAQSLIERGDAEFEDMISAIDDDKRTAEKERAEADIMLRQAMKKQDEMDRRLAEFQNKKDDMMLDARRQARELIKEAKAISDEIKRDLKNLTKIDSMGKRNAGFQENRRRIKDAETRYSEPRIKKVNTKPVDISELKAGSIVRVLSLDQKGEVLALPDNKGEVQVRIGALKANIPTDDLMILVEGKTDNKEKKRKQTGYGAMLREKRRSVPMSKNVIGENLDSAKIDVEKYIDDAFMAGLSEVTIIHGSGSGILRDGLRKELKKNRNIKSFRQGKSDEGGNGVTVVTLKGE